MSTLIPQPLTIHLQGPAQADTGTVAVAEVISVAGEVDLSSAHQLAAALRTAESAGGGAVVVDLRDVTFIDSSGLHVLLDARRRMSGMGRPMPLVCGPEHPVRRLLELTTLVDRFSLFTSPGAAMAPSGLPGPPV